MHGPTWHKDDIRQIRSLSLSHQTLCTRQVEEIYLLLPDVHSPSTTLFLPPSLQPIRSLLTGFTSNGIPPVAEYHPTLRGGQTTYHGPGQLVTYTILDLRRLGLTPRCHIRLLENSVVNVLRDFGIRGFVTENPGVWVCTATDPPDLTTRKIKKIAAVGVHLRRHISSYVGLNVTKEPMWFFQQIVACGLDGREATSLAGQGVEGVTMEDTADRFVRSFVERLKSDFSGNGETIDSVYKIEEKDVVET